jgi:hypothetical protein
MEDFTLQLVPLNGVGFAENAWSFNIEGMDVLVNRQKEEEGVALMLRLRGHEIDMTSHILIEIMATALSRGGRSQASSVLLRQHIQDRHIMMSIWYRISEKI